MVRALGVKDVTQMETSSSVQTTP